jgi:glycosyltransferase involved in cell wall biosynthesis
MGRFLQDAIESVLAQDYEPIQYIVVDGGSDDDTLDILRGYGDRIQWCSEADEGTADALRKGFEAAEGAVFGWLNADDLLLPGAVSEAVQALAENPQASAVYAGGHWTGPSGNPLGSYPVQDYTPEALSRECIVCQPACFFRSDAYRSCGGIDTNIETVFDWDLWIRLARAGPLHRVAGDWAIVRMHDDTKTLGQRRLVLEEGARLLARHYGYVPFDWIYARLCHEQDGRDQFYEPLKPSVLAWWRSLGVGWRANRGLRRRYLEQWAGAVTLEGAIRQLRRDLFRSGSKPQR